MSRVKVFPNQNFKKIFNGKATCNNKLGPNQFFEFINKSIY